VLKVNEINVVTDAGNLMRARVNIISYDMVPRMVDRIRERHFQVIIAVRIGRGIVLLTAIAHSSWTCFHFFLATGRIALSEEQQGQAHGSGAAAVAGRRAGHLAVRNARAVAPGGAVHSDPGN